MKIYLVGGAVRDELLHLPVKEKDWVVVGATVEEMLTCGFKQVGKDFPVFLHPKTREEYALARKERKVKKGYTGFEFDASPLVTLEEDLKRRDLTINAMAKTATGELIDPYGGQADLKNKLLRHVSPAFSEDPVRILRVARFFARYAKMGFSVADSTILLMRQMVEAGEVDALVPERVFKELERALGEAEPMCFFKLLEASGALEILFPEIILAEVTFPALKETDISFAVLLHYLSNKKINQFCDRYRIANDYRELACLTADYHREYSLIDQLDGEKIIQLLQWVDAFRREKRFHKWLKACDLSTHQTLSETWLTYWRAAKQVDMNKIKEQCKDKPTGDEIRMAVWQERVRLVNLILQKK